MDVGWYARRLSAMSPTEVARRARQQARHAVWRVRPRSAVPAARSSRDFFAGLPAYATLDIEPQAVQRLVDRAGEILAGSIDVLGAQRDDLQHPDWFFDPVSGRGAPRDVHASRIATRDAARVGSIKHVWELSRHQYLVGLAAAYWCTGDERYARRVDEHLRSWWAANPFLTGVHWTSGIELGLRLVSWVWIRRFLDAWPPVEELFEANAACLTQLADHQRYLAAFVTVGSSANNHVLAEAVGQLVAATAFPWFDRSDRWRADALRLLQDELAAQTFPSGLNRELATDYHGFVLELALVAAAEVALGGADVPAGIAEPIVRMTDALAMIVDCRLHPPRQGDSDGGSGLVVDPLGPGRWASLLSVGAGTFGPCAWWPPLPEPDVRATVLRAALRGHVPAPADRPQARASLLADAGMVVVRATVGDDELWCRGDVGPHGFTSIAAHAHADALSLELRVDGVEVLADPGTYCYHGAPPWRSYFRGTAGHSTLQVDGRDQSTSGGPFLWTRHAGSRLLSSSGLQDGPVARWVAEHDGYSRRGAPLVHRRTVDLHRTDGRLIVVDQLLGAGRHPVCLSFHLGPTVCCELDGAQARLGWPGRPCAATVRLDPRLAWQVHRGEDAPPLGWYSPAFGRKVPAVTLVGKGVVAAGDELRCDVVFAATQVPPG
jgi:hypothetical protein